MGRQRLGYLASDAGFSDDRLYRYWLSRRLSMGESSILFVGLNPSTADAIEDDPTIRRCIGFARRWGYDWFYMGNIHAWRSTDPKLLPADPLKAVGSENQQHLKRLMHKADTVVAAWGAYPLNDYAFMLAQIIRAHGALCLGRNKDGSPKHPLYVNGKTEAMPWK